MRSSWMPRPPPPSSASTKQRSGLTRCLRLFADHGPAHRGPTARAPGPAPGPPQLGRHRGAQGPGGGLRRLGIPRGLRRSLMAPRLFVGASGFGYKEWKGPFYPEDLKDSEMLDYYAGRYPRSRSTTRSTACPRPSCSRTGPARPRTASASSSRRRAADHPFRAAEGRGERGRVPLQDHGHLGRQARSHPVPAAAQPEEGPGPPRGLPRARSAGPRGRARVPPRQLVRRRRVRGAASRTSALCVAEPTRTTGRCPNRSRRRPGATSASAARTMTTPT